MKRMRSLLNQLPWSVVVILCATLGLAPFTPPHVVEKLSMLAKGTLVKPVDWFDLAFHGVPWLLLALKLVATRMVPAGKPGTED